MLTLQERINASINLQERINAALNLLPKHMDPIERKIYTTLCPFIGHGDGALLVLLRLTQSIALAVKTKGGPDLEPKNLSLAFLSDDGKSLLFLVVIHIVSLNTPNDHHSAVVIRAVVGSGDDVAFKLEKVLLARTWRVNC
ncbi:hypothetical protein GMOD_00005871 [Pyrenophora seminiperda CCB06]|uniref:Uncharacterized protein n=1 Tax=Pyrenophora seminiperda CCB06 TaxID=1302712 RepID=A0A3M7MAD3_9PLEO|nr:hypothetical protein GMOD_00005871 [Pyrenophora seminiperda CCB06]